MHIKTLTLTIIIIIIFVFAVCSNSCPCGIKKLHQILFRIKELQKCRHQIWNQVERLGKK